MIYKDDQRGMASIVIVGVLVVLLALITLGFSRIMGRAVTNSLHNQLSAAANYAAQSAINDAMAYIKGQASPDDVSSSDCTSLLKEPGMSNLVDLSGNGNTKITCLLVNPRPSDLMYQQLAPNGTQIVKATTSDAVDKLMFSWQASNGTNTSLPATLSFPDVVTWNSAGYVPVLRVGLYPVPPDGKISGIQDNAKTFFLVPGNGSGTVTTIPFTTADGSVIQVACNAKNTGISGLTADYTCNAIVNGLYSDIAPNSYYYMTLTPIYNQADVKVKADNTKDQAVQFVDVQTVIDATAKANTATKRLQERVDSNTTGDNISSTEYAAPGFAVRSAKALCKQLELHKSYYNYILNDAPATCTSGASGIPTVAPTLTLTVTGNDGSDSGTTRDSGDATPGGSGYSGVVYINSSATVNWKSTDAATSCMASSSPLATDTNGYKWNGDKNPPTYTSWSGVTGTGSAQFNGITIYTTYSMQCRGPGGVTDTKTVTAWPPPRVDFGGSTGAHNSDQPYTVKWNSYNASKCTVSSSGNQPWNSTYTSLNPAGDSKQQTFGGPSYWNDHGQKTYTVICYDPIGRSTPPATWTVGPNSPDSPTYGPTCTATASFSPNRLAGSAYITWDAECPAVQADQGNYHIDSNIPGWNSGDIPASSRTETVALNAGDYSFRIYAWAPGWGSASSPNADSGTQTATIHYKITGLSLTSPNGLWNQSPRCNSPGNWWDTSWWCWRDGNNKTTYPGGGSYNGQSLCADGAHEWTMCDIKWSSSAGTDTSSISCRIDSSQGAMLSGEPNSGTKSGPGPTNGWGWGDTYTGGGYGPNPNNFTLTCSTPWDTESQSFNIP